MAVWVVGWAFSATEDTRLIRAPWKFGFLQLSCYGVWIINSVLNTLIACGKDVV